MGSLNFSPYELRRMVKNPRLSEPPPLLPRMVSFEEPRQRGGLGIAEHYGRFPTTRTFDAMEAYCE